MNFTHRANKSDLYFMWGLLAFWTILAIVIVPLFPEIEMLAVPFFLSWILLAIYGIVEAKRRYLHITDDTVERIGVFGAARSN